MSAVLLVAREEVSTAINAEPETKDGKQPIDVEAARRLLQQSLRRKYEVLALLCRAFA